SEATAAEPPACVDRAVPDSRPGVHRDRSKPRRARARRLRAAAVSGRHASRAAGLHRISSRGMANDPTRAARSRGNVIPTFALALRGSSLKRALILFALLASVAYAQSGGELRLCIRQEPKTYNPLQVTEDASETIRYLTGGVLVRVNRLTQQP